MLFLGELPDKITEIIIKRSKIMSNSQHDQHDHHEDNSVNVKIALFFVAVIAALVFIGWIN